jgi:hypothetical protein
MAMLSIALLMLLVSPAAPVSVAGTWNLSTNVHGNTSTPSCTFKQEAEKITGACSAPNNTQSEVTGEVVDTKVVFRYNIDWEGNALTLVYTGTVESDTTMKGAIDVQPMNVPGEFTATKAK